MTRKKYIAVFYNHFAGHIEGRDVKTIEASNYEDAYNQAAGFNYNRDSSWSHSEFKLIELATGERPRRLTWKERFLGRIE